MRSPLRSPSFAAGTLLAASLFAPRHASANPRPLPFTYIYETLPEGEAELEQYADAVPEKVLSVSRGAPVYLVATQFQTELEYGITDRAELGLYLTIAPRPGEDFSQVGPLTEGTGIKERIHYRFGDGDWPIDVGVYGELVEFENEFEIEGKVILQKKFGNLRLATNLWAEREWYYAKTERSWVLNPTLGASYQVTPKFLPGIESWMRVEFPSPPEHPRPFDAGPHVYAGPVMLFNFGRVWWSVGAYLRATDFGRSPNPGDPFGSVWFRSVFGIGL